MKHSQSLAVRICLPCLIVSCFWPSGLWAEDAVIIGATQQQERFLTCVLHISDDDLRGTPNSNDQLAIVILEHQKFLQAKDSFGAYRTKLAFSNLAMRRMYLSSDIFRDMDNALRCITHELGHFATQSKYEHHAEFAAGRYRKIARERCPSDVR